MITALLLTGCAAAPAPVIEDDMAAFTQGIDSMLKIGMTIREARAVLRERMPAASINTDAPVPGNKSSPKMRRIMVGWPTLNHGTTLIVTIYCDRHGKIVRWTTGPLTE
jgi:hypothetical protein